ncbi:MAG: hypothetical protein ABI462_04590 [Ignavibacteria bacterium]
MNFINEIEINIVKDIILVADALAPRLGIEVDTFLINTLNLNDKPLLLHLNVRNTNPIDYLFTKNAFGNAFKIISNDDKTDVIYYVETDNQKWHLLKGLLTYINPEYILSDWIEEEIQIANLSIKICKNLDIIFLGQLTDNEKRVLKEVNSKMEIGTYDMIELFKSEMEAHLLTSTIETLKQKKFIYSNGDKVSETLISVKNKIKNYV